MNIEQSIQNAIDAGKKAFARGEADHLMGSKTFKEPALSTPRSTAYTGFQPDEIMEGKSYCCYGKFQILESNLK